MSQGKVKSVSSGEQECTIRAGLAVVEPTGRVLGSIRGRRAWTPVLDGKPLDDFKVVERIRLRVKD